MFCSGYVMVFAVSASSPCTGLDFYFLTWLLNHCLAKISTGTGECKFTLHFVIFSGLTYLLHGYFTLNRMWVQVHLALGNVGCSLLSLTWVFTQFLAWNCFRVMWVQVHLALDLFSAANLFPLLNIWLKCQQIFTAICECKFTLHSLYFSWL